MKHILYNTYCYKNLPHTFLTTPDKNSCTPNLNKLLCYLHQKFVTDLSASNKRIDALDAEVKEFEKQKHSQIDKVRARQRQIHAAWQRLNKLKAQKERSLQGKFFVITLIMVWDERFVAIYIDRQIGSDYLWPHSSYKWV